MAFPSFRIGLRTYLVYVTLLSLTLAYVSTYYRLSRQGMREASLYGIPGFLYVPFEEARACECLTHHYALAAFYAPLNWLDQRVFDGPSPVVCICIMWRLSG